MKPATASGTAAHGLSSSCCRPLVKGDGKPEMKAEKGTEVTYDVQAIPRVTSQGCVCGAVYRVASERNFNSGVS